MGKYTARDKIRQSEYYRETLAKGLCYKCHKPNTNIGKKRCIDCIKRDSHAAKALREKRRLVNQCIECAAEEIYKSNRCIRCAQKLYINRLKMKEEVFSHYGNGCVICGEKDIIVLQLDHINGGGTRHRAELGSKKAGYHFYYKLRKASYPNGLQILCANCHIKKHACRMALAVGRLCV